MIKELKTYQNKFAALLFSLLIAMDWFQSQWEFYVNIDRSNLMLYSRGFILLVFAYFAVKSSKKIAYISSFLFLSYAIAYQTNMLEISNMELFLKYLSPFVYLLGFQALMEDKEVYSGFYKTNLAIIFIGLIFILLGFIFGIESFATYETRFGFKGLFKRSIDASYFIIYAILFSYFIVKNLRLQRILFALIFIATLVLGTKIPWLFIGLFLLFVLYQNPKRKQIAIYASLGALSSLVLIRVFLINSFKDTYNLFYSIYLEHGIIASITSYRSLLLEESMYQYKQVWSFKNYLFGGKLPSIDLVEMSLADLFIFFGILGSFLYLILYYLLYLKNQNTNFRWAYIFVLFASLLAGQFFFNPSVSLLFASLAVLTMRKKEFDL